MEIKNFDHTCNHYFAMAAVIAIGIKGIKNGDKLPEPFLSDPGALT
jgi:glutamine synthetase